MTTSNESKIMIKEFRAIIILRGALKILPGFTSFSLISFLVLINLISSSVAAQPGKFKLEDLINKTWRMQGLNELTNDENYGVDHICLNLNNEYVGKQEFYLSDSIVTVFDSISVGKVKEGRFIVRRTLRDERCPGQPLRVSVFEIMKLNSDTLIIRNIKHQDLLMFLLK